MSTPVEYDPDEETYRVPLGEATDRATVGVIVDAVAEIDEVDPTELASLSTRMDPEALDALLTSAAAAPGGDSVAVEFSCWGYRITVGPDEAVIVPDRDEDPADR